MPRGNAHLRDDRGVGLPPKELRPSHVMQESGTPGWVDWQSARIRRAELPRDLYGLAPRPRHHGHQHIPKQRIVVLIKRGEQQADDGRSRAHQWACYRTGRPSMSRHAGSTTVGDRLNLSDAGVVSWVMGRWSRVVSPTYWVAWFCDGRRLLGLTIAAHLGKGRSDSPDEDV
jgi:hypothetical protein